MKDKPNWTEIFIRHPELEPPGYKEVCEKIKSQDKSRKTKAHRKVRSTRKSSFPSLKHGAT